MLVAAIAVLVSVRALSFVPTYPVRGSVLVAGKPANGAIVEFRLVGGIDLPVRIPRGRVREDGSFELAMGDGQVGAPIGSYAVTVTWREEVFPNVLGNHLVPRTYSEKGSTPLRATVIEGTNALPPFRIERGRSRGENGASTSGKVIL